ncbi:MAG: ABC transporter permease [Flavobacteriales bacterium]|nr:ABC transporter permease [Flavobacteriales bacterium]MCB9363499.1 ABC transporter permease [Flavobacteriales bacterium]
MLDLLKIEYKKIIPFTTFWVIFGLFFIFTPIVFYGAGQIKIEGFPIDFATMYNFPNVWNNVTYIASWFNLLIGMLLVILVCNEFSFKTFRQHVIDGQNKADFIVSKVLLMTSFAFFCTLYLFVIGALFGFISGSDAGLFLKDINYLLIYFVQSLGYMTVGLIIAIIIRSSAMSIITFLCSILVESIIRAFVPSPIDQYFPMKIISNLTPFPTPNGIMVNQMGPTAPETISLATTVIVAVVYILIFWGISYFILTKKDIK